MKANAIPKEIIEKLNTGVVIPAMPLALNSKRKLDERRQRALIRYYLDAASGGLAVAVHTTQFAIRKPEVGLYEPLLTIAGEEFSRFTSNTGKQAIRIAGVIGKTEQALKEANLAMNKGFHAVLLSLAAFRDTPNNDIIKHCREIAGIMPVIGFYLQPAVGGRKLDVNFWREFAGIENVIAIKIAPFNRYQTFDVLRGVAESGRSDQIALYTGNDDNILVDLLSVYEIPHGNRIIKKRITGGLLGHWAVWTRSAVKLLNSVHAGEYDNDVVKMLTLANKITDCNAAFFDAANNFAGCITGLHEVLRRQGLLEGLWTLDPDEVLSPGQLEEIDRVYSAYPDLNDDTFVAENLDRWLA
ncbi:MAG: dihydrodipicolinate synthase family protein [Bacteroidetes bacterium GWE2_41_25]|nr:MAG: dihydrodipicolinate synthase family protein [Bacteroidetes bacterium GWA2_40_15]OFX92883.1 MAG: dihydrodipicolinate synthase family protein [Bacteroidetes bacterium GWC2_40_22]OFX93597.1 MAG: dihydrodipicolinate synthase family protein [Bacteroidetes bacterium GWE2_41_25]OFY59386.1 MAG: dihydrodipicolinate synthase family protein [Bacteroidetes bacterium GWF2_41_9]HAM09482.1 dihydrodipicolinate synthase family protein [Bacteroidales bacterium]